MKAEYIKNSRTVLSLISDNSHCDGGGGGGSGSGSSSCSSGSGSGSGSDRGSGSGSGSDSGSSSGSGSGKRSGSDSAIASRSRSRSGKTYFRMFRDPVPQYCQNSHGGHVRVRRQQLTDGVTWTHTVLQFIKPYCWWSNETTRGKQRIHLSNTVSCYSTVSYKETKKRKISESIT